MFSRKKLKTLSLDELDKELKQAKKDDNLRYILKICQEINNRYFKISSESIINKYHKAINMIDEFEGDLENKSIPDKAKLRDVLKQVRADSVKRIELYNSYLTE